LAAIYGFQVIYGFVYQVMEVPELPTDYICRGWTPCILKNLAALDGRMSIEQVGIPTLHHLDDQFLMEAIANCGDIRPEER